MHESIKYYRFGFINIGCSLLADLIYRSRLTNSSIASEIISILRLMFSSELWASSLNIILRDSIGRLATLPNDLSCNSRSGVSDWPRDLVDDIELVLSALSVLGGFIDTLREGSKVEVEVDDEKIKGVVIFDWYLVFVGTVVNIGLKKKITVITVSPDCENADILLDSFEKISCIVDVDLGPPLLFAKEILASIGSFLLTCPKINFGANSSSQLIYSQLQRRVMKVLSVLLQNPLYIDIFLNHGKVFENSPIYARLCGSVRQSSSCASYYPF